MEDLPEDMILKIFTHLPPEPLFKCKLVCKKWENILLSHKKVGILFLFRSCWERNLQLFYGDYEEIFSKISSGEADFSFKSLTKINHPVINRRETQLSVDQMVGSCNGLVCLRVPHHDINDPVYICNPMTREYINLPRLEYKFGFVVSGFGYDPSTNDYKVIRIHYRGRSRWYRPVTKGFVEIYTLGRDSAGWRSLGEVTYTLNKRGVLANGSLYWLDYDKKKIVAFDLADEIFQLLPDVPQCFGGSSELVEYQIKVLGGNLCLVHFDRGRQLDIWSYKNKQKKTDDKEEGSHSCSWSLEFHIPSSALGVNDVYEPFALTKNNEILMWWNGTGICCYDTKTKIMNEMLDEKFNKLRNFQGIPHMNSFLSIKPLGGKNLKTENHQNKKKRKPKFVDDESDN
ncbi:F-box protein At3g07870-like [Papaver somniferum]|uniref:F-box protein At3g07870-like n=1 Tax=Papaver somniferum TaxID=3469 RepID=UPI000E6FE23F|nr:F-box protein At3g07870-like [Papaver somniferum]